jgi:hypothetical protein
MLTIAGGIILAWLAGWVAIFLGGLLCLVVQRMNDVGPSFKGLAILAGCGGGLFLLFSMFFG